MTEYLPKSNLLCITHDNGDSTATHHYWFQHDQSCLSKMQPET